MRNIGKINSRAISISADAYYGYLQAVYQTHTYSKEVGKCARQDG